MDLNQKILQVKLAPLNGVTQAKSSTKSKDRSRLKGGCTNLMYACQQGLTDTIVKEVRLQVNIKYRLKFCFDSFHEFKTRKYLTVN